MFGEGTDRENIKNMNEGDFWHQAQVYSNNYKKEAKTRRKDITLSLRAL